MNDVQRPPVSKAVARGQPQFASADLQQVASALGPAAAWARLASADDATLSAIGGDFGYGTVDDTGHGWLIADPFATHPLCWTLRDGRLLFAERADALADASTEIDPQAIYDYLFFHCIPSPRTIYKGIYRLPAAHALRWNGQGEPRVWRYWTPQFVEPARADFETLKAEFRELLKQSVARSLDGSKPACFLSGGTDSSTVAGMLREVTGQGADSYSIGFEAEGYDEMAYARIAAQRFGTRQHEYYVTPQDILDGLPRVANHYDQPFGNSSALPAFYCGRMAQADGVSRILAGDGGDELFGGNARYAKQRVFGWYQQVPGPLRRGLLEPLLLRGWSFPLLRKGGSYVEQARVPMPARLSMYNLLLRVGPEALLTPQLLAAVDAQGPQAHQQGVWDQTPTALELNQTLAFDWRYTLAESDLPKVVGMTQAAGLGVAFPLLDRKLLDFSLRLPADYKLKGLKLRWFFKEALRGFLPDEIITKQKHGFGLPFGVWLNRHPALGRFAADAVRSLVGRRVVRGEFIETLLSELLPQHPGYYGELVWILTVLELWLRDRKPDFRMP